MNLLLPRIDSSAAVVLLATDISTSRYRLCFTNGRAEIAPDVPLGHLHLLSSPVLRDEL